MTNRRKLPSGHGVLLLAVPIVVIPLGLFLMPEVLATTYIRDVVGVAVENEGVAEPLASRHSAFMKTPEPVKGIYMSQCVAGTPTFRDSLVRFVEESDLNAIVIDLKDYSGTIAFPTMDPRFESATLVSCGARDMEAFVKTLHEKGIYVIGRITVFQDPHYSQAHPEQAVESKARPGEPWKDHKGLNFVDVSSREFWDYIVTLSEEASALGFDELNYDYIRYPSDGPMDDAVYQNPNKPEALETFFAYLHEEVKPLGVVMSADLFGMVASNTDDLGIGQVLERSLPYFDYVMPMVYPSHYPDGFNGYSDPNLYPYEVVNYAMEHAVRRTTASETVVQTLDGETLFASVVVPATETAATTTKEVATGRYTKSVYDPKKIRPWLQDFDYGKDYLPGDILAQTKATYDAGLTSWIFWDPANKYENLRAVMSE